MKFAIGTVRRSAVLGTFVEVDMRPRKLLTPAGTPAASHAQIGETFLVGFDPDGETARIVPPGDIDTLLSAAEEAIEWGAETLALKAAVERVRKDPLSASARSDV